MRIPVTLTAIAVALGVVALANAQVYKPSGGGSSSVTSGTTASSGCTDNGVLESRSNLITCDGAILAPSGGPVTIGNGGGSTRQLIFAPNAGNSIGFGMISGGGALVGFLNAVTSFQMNASYTLTNAGAFQWTNSSNPTTAADTSLTRVAVGTVGIPTIVTDATHTDSTLCQDTTTHGIYFGSGTAGICLGTSGRQFKTNIEPMASGLDEIMKLDFVNYRYLPGYGDNGARKQYGLIAQDVEKVIPELAGHDEKGETINYDMGAIWMMYGHALQQLKSDNDNLRTEIEDLKRRVH